VQRQKPPDNTPVKVSATYGTVLSFATMLHLITQDSSPPFQKTSAQLLAYWLGDFYICRPKEESSNEKRYSPRIP
jgi:hypothetical protein